LIKRLVASLSVYERIEWMQEKDPSKIPAGDFAVSLKSGMNIPVGAIPRKELKLRIMLSPDDE
jgi:hypothetical protein